MAHITLLVKSVITAALSYSSHCLHTTEGVRACSISCCTSLLLGDRSSASLDYNVTSGFPSHSSMMQLVLSKMEDIVPLSKLHHRKSQLQRVLRLDAYLACPKKRAYCITCYLYSQGVCSMQASQGRRNH